jgi:predicted flap endonuclease-1-like 5' DNA nuclease
MLYGVAIILFAITGILYFVLTVEYERMVSVVATVTFGILFTGLGYVLRPRAKPSTTAVAAPAAPSPSVTAAPPSTPKPEPTPAATDQVEEKTATPTEFVPLKFRLTKIRGIGEKRSTQLKALGISNVKDLSNASAKELATQLDVSPKTTARWIANAKEIVEKS